MFHDENPNSWRKFFCCRFTKLLINLNVKLILSINSQISVQYFFYFLKDIILTILIIIYGWHFSSKSYSMRFHSVINLTVYSPTVASEPDEVTANANIS